MIHVIVIDSYILLFRGGKPLEVMEIWFTAPHCLFSTHINYNQNQERVKLPSHVYRMCFAVFFFFGFRSPWLCEPWHFQHLINAFMQMQCTCMHGHTFMYELQHSQRHFSFKRIIAYKKRQLLL